MTLDTVVESKEVPASGRRLSLTHDGKEIGRAYVYFMKNDLHGDEPFAYLEDVHLDEAYRGKDLGKQLVDQAIAAAKEEGCYKMVFTSRMSRERLHAWYEGQGFEKTSFGFRMNF